MTPSPDAPPLREIVPAIADRPVVVVVGHEGDGLSDAALAACTHHARIPMTNNVDSLNVATAAAIALYAVTSRDFTERTKPRRRGSETVRSNPRSRLRGSWITCSHVQSSCVSVRSPLKKLLAAQAVLSQPCAGAR